MLSSDHEILRPTPRRTFELTPASSESSAPTTPYPEPTNPNMLDPKPNSDLPPSRTRSILNLTSSTLFGIYSPTGYDTTRDEPSTPWGTGAQTPSGHRSLDNSTATSPAIADWERLRSKRTKSGPQSHQPHTGAGNHLLSMVLRTVLLFVFGVAYGVIITHLHDNHHLAPVQVKGIDRYSWTYLGFWGIAGVALGSLLPWVDILWDDKLRNTGEDSETGPTTKKETNPVSSNNDNNTEDEDEKSSSLRSNDWTPVVRSIGAFVGIAFAIVSHTRSPPSSFTTTTTTNPLIFFFFFFSKA
ncbi:MAG: hypothetical protein M1812_000524 [Candelaria pacifica]|nr:MAG: hypothetical protein M1812_000524 [Candelaria pacifica]